MAWFPVAVAVVVFAGVAEAHPKAMLNALLAVKTKAKQASATTNKATMEATEQQRALQSYAAGMAGVAAADRQVLAETKLAAEQAEHLLRGTAAAPKVAQLLEHMQKAGKHLVAIESHSASSARHESALLGTGLHGGLHTGRMQKMQQELQIAQQRVASLMRKHPKELHKVEGLLHTASRMIKHAAVAKSLQQQANARIALLTGREGKGHEASASEVAMSKHALLHYAEGMEKVVNVDKGITAATGKAKEQMKDIFQGKNQGIGFEVSQLLDAAQNEERNVVAMESNDAHEARSEAGQLGGGLLHEAEDHGDHGDLARTLTDFASNAAASSLTDFATNAAGIFGQHHIMSETVQPEDDAEGLLRSIRGSTLTQENVARRPHRAILTESSSSLRAKLRAKLQPVKRALAQNLELAMRQTQLAERGENLASQLQETSNAVVEGLQEGPDPVDRDVAVELQKHLNAAEKMLHDLAFVHKEMALDVKHKVGALVSYARKLVSSERRHDTAQLLQGQGRAGTSAATSLLKRAAHRAMTHAAAELRTEHRLFAETAAAEQAVQRDLQDVKGPDAKQVRSIVGQALRGAQQAEKSAAAAAKIEMQRARRAAR